MLLDQVEARLGSKFSIEIEMEFVLTSTKLRTRTGAMAYKSFFGYTWAARRRKRQQEQDEAFNRELAPINDEDGHR